MDKLLTYLRWLLVTIYLIIATLFATERLLEPWVERQAPALEQELGRLLGLRWEIDGLDVSWRRLSPVVSVQRLTASNIINVSEDAAIAEPELMIGQAHLYVDLINSIRSGELRLFGFGAAEVALQLLRDEGHWTIKGLRDKGRKGHFRLDDFASALRYADIERLSLIVEQAPALDQKPVVRELPDTYLHFFRERNNAQLQFGYCADSTVQGSDFRVEASLTGEPISNPSAIEAYAVSQKSGLSLWLELFFPGIQFSGVDGEIWISKPPDGDLLASLELNELTMSMHGQQNADSLNAERSLVLRDFNAELLPAAVNGLELRWSKFQLAYAEQQLDFQPGYAWSEPVAGHNDGASLILPIQQFDLGLLTSFILDTDILTPEYTDIVKALDFSGLMKNVRLTLPVADPAGFTIDAELEKVSVKSWYDAPAGSDIDGNIRLSSKGGVVELERDDYLALLFPGVYLEPLELMVETAVVEWEIEEERFYIDGRNIRAHSLQGEGDLAARFFVNGKARGEHASQMALEVGATNSTVGTLLPFIPSNVPVELRDWVAQSGAVGDVIHGGVIYNGSLRVSEPELREVQMFFEISDASLQYLEGWPQVTAASGLLQITPDITRVDLHQAKSSDLNILQADILVDTEGNDKRVEVNLGLDGSAQGLLRLLQESPTGELLNDVIGRWTAQGDIYQGRLNLNTPLQLPDLESIDIDFSGRLNNVDLQMTNFNLALNGLGGAVGYDSRRGLHAESLTASLWGKPVDIQLGQYPSGVDPVASRLLVEANGTVAANDLNQWLKRPELGFASGETPVQFALDHSERTSRLMVSSDLTGIAVSAPAPFFKTATDSLPLHLEWDLDSDYQPLHIRAAEVAALKLAYKDFEFLGGLLWLGDEQEVEALSAGIFASSFSELEKQALYREEAFILSGSLDLFNLSVWHNAVEQYQSYDIFTGANADDKPELELVGRELLVHRAQVFDVNIDDAVVNFYEQPHHYMFEVESRLVKGEIGLPVDDGDWVNELPATASALQKDSDLAELGQMPVIPENVPLKNRLILDLDYLRLPLSYFSEDALARKQSALDQFEQPFLLPASLSSMKIDIDQLYIGSAVYGGWSFLLTTSANAALVHDVRADIWSLKLSSDADDGLLWAVDGNGDINSNLNIEVSSKRFDKFLRSISEGAELPMESEMMDADINLSWTAAPDKISLELLEGDARFELGRGRFFQAPQSATGLLKVLGLINFDTLLRRIQLDFGDVYKEGLSFDKITGQLAFADNQLSFRDSPIEVSAPSSKFSLAGDIDLNVSTIDAQLVATLPVAKNLPWIAAFLGNFPVAAGAYIVTRMFDEQFEQLSSAAYRIEGDLDDPKVTFDRLFDTSVPDKADEFESDAAVNSADNNNSNSVSNGVSNSGSTKIR